jgi:hypothetical protein
MRKTTAASILIGITVILLSPLYSSDDSMKILMVDEIDRYHGKRVVGTLIELSNNEGSTTFLEPGVRFEEEGPQYFLMFHLYAYDWFSIEECFFAIDSDLFLFPKANEARNVIVNGVIKELVTFYTTRDFFEKLMTAHSVKIRIRGRGEIREFSLTGVHATAIQKLMNYIEKIQL